MRGIFKRGGRTAQKDAPWIVAYYGEHGVRQTRSMCADRDAAEQVACEVECDVGLGTVLETDWR